MDISEKTIGEIQSKKWTNSSVAQFLVKNRFVEMKHSSDFYLHRFASITI